MGSSGPEARRNARNYRPELKRSAEKLGKVHRVQVLVEPTLFVRTPPGDDNGASVEDALTALLEGNQDITWRKVVIARRADDVPDVETLASDVRFWDATGLSHLSAYRSSKRRTTFVLSSRSQEPETEPEPGGQTTTFYLIYGVDNHLSVSPSERLSKLLRAQMEQLVRMSPEQVAATMEDAIRSYQSAPSEAGRQHITALPVMAGMMAVWFPIAAKEGILKP